MEISTYINDAPQQTAQKAQTEQAQAELLATLELMYLDAPADDVLRELGQPWSTRVVGNDENGLVVEWHYPQVDLILARRYRDYDGMTVYRVVKVSLPEDLIRK